MQLDQIVEVMMWMVLMQYVCQRNVLNQEMMEDACIKVDSIQHLTHMRWNLKCNKSISEILNDNIYFNKKTQDWHVDCCTRHLDNKHQVRIVNMQQAATSRTDQKY